MRLILARHGNTFKEGEKVTAVGAWQDLPLTEKGYEQARAFGKMLAAKNIAPDAVYCSPLKRTRDFLQEALRQAGIKLNPVEMEVLREIDYGLWTGKTDQEIQREFGFEAWRAWQEESRWPQNARWHPQETELIASIRNFTGELIASWPGDSAFILIGSSGVLRYFLKLPDGEWEARVKNKSLKKAPGSYGEIVHENGGFRCVCWNEKPI
ncbi:MAG: histidine phosphatase family protein [Elusimicrobia bacterium]|nr:histidine phosphatase family protein [Elusimicrobiota bacterium]